MCGAGTLYVLKLLRYFPNPNKIKKIVAILNTFTRQMVPDFIK